MAEATVTSVVKKNWGSDNVVIAKFTSVSDTNTWTSGIKGVIWHFAQGTGNPTTQTSAGIAVTESSGTFTFYPGEDALPCTLFVGVE